MRVESLKLQGFRNIAQQELRPVAGTNVIYGDNAQGKTNLLEAIWLFTGAKSFRSAKDSEFIRFSEQFASLEMDFTAQERPQYAALRYNIEKAKTVQLNGIKQKGVAAFSGVFCAVLFSPDHLDLIKQGPGKRRRMLDVSLCQAYPKYQLILHRYEKILQRRAVLLKDIQLRLQPRDLLDAWDESFIDYGAYIIWMRARYAAKLTRYAQEVYDGIASGREPFGAQYLSAVGPVDHDADRKELHEKLTAAVAGSRDEDLRLGINSVGPHRDDLDILVDGKSARAFASQGQQRSCVLALKLAECRLLEESSGEPPVVLLDDVMSELDAGRRAYLLGRLDGRQVFITCCEPELLGGIGEDGMLLHIRGGEWEQA